VRYGETSIIGLGHSKDLVDQKVWFAIDALIR